MAQTWTSGFDTGLQYKPATITIDDKKLHLCFVTHE